ncbi:MAG: glycoside hydrolase family 3 N-terminal domain-containing protein [Gemmatimonadota bacterium]
MIRSHPRFLALTLAVALAQGGPRDVQAQARSLAPPDTAWVERTLASLSLERKVAQLVTPDLSSAGYISEEDPRLQQWVTLARAGVGTFVLYGGTPRDVAWLTNRLQREAEIPLLISADFEGGPGQQVVGASEYPPNMALAAAGDTVLMYRAASAAADEGRAMGIHLTYTPVVDIAVRPENPQESSRSFGGDLDLLGRMVRAYVRGYHDHGMLTTAKHFPGRGDQVPMPGNPPWMWNPKTEAQLETQEFTAFRHGVAAGVDFMMSEHIAVPAVAGGSDLPASVEPRLATGVVRGRLGFRGMLTTDDLWYDHVVARFGAEEVALRAFEAGHDILLKPRDPVAVIAALTGAVRSGRIAEARVDDAVRRLLLLKTRLGLHRERMVDEGAVGDMVFTPAHHALVQEIADRSLTLLRNEGVLPVTAPRRLVNVSIQKTDIDPGPPLLEAKLASAFPGTRSFTVRPGQSSEARAAIVTAAADADLVVVSLFVQRDRSGDAAPLRDSDGELIRTLMAAHPGRVVAMVYGNPHLARALPDTPTLLVGYGERTWYGNQDAYFDAFVRTLTGKLLPTGRLPVHVSDRYPLGSGIVHH